MLAFENSGNSPKKIVTIALQMRGYLACVVGMPDTPACLLSGSGARETIFLGKLRKPQKQPCRISPVNRKFN